MSGAMQTIFGIPISESIFVPEFQITSNRVHQISNKTMHKKYQVYHNRIQKKWNKRFGQTKSRCMYKMYDQLIVHPNTMALIKVSKDVNQYMECHHRG